MMSYLSVLLLVINGVIYSLDSQSDLAPVSPYYTYCSGFVYRGFQNLSDCWQCQESRACCHASCSDDPELDCLKKAYFQYNLFLGVDDSLSKSVFWSKHRFVEDCKKFIDDLAEDILDFIVEHTADVSFKCVENKPIIEICGSVKMDRLASDSAVFFSRPIWTMNVLIKTDEFEEMFFEIVDEGSIALMEIVNAYRDVLRLDEFSPAIELHLALYMTDEMVKALVLQKKNSEDSESSDCSCCSDCNNEMS